MSNEERVEHLPTSMKGILKALSDLYNYVDASMPSSGESLRLFWNMLWICKGIQEILRLSNLQETESYQELTDWKANLKQKMMLTFRIYFQQQVFSEDKIQSLMEEQKKILDPI